MISFFKPIFQCQCLVTCHTHRLILLFMEVLTAVISWTSSAASMSFCNLKYLCYLVNHQHLTWAHYWLQWPFQNCGLPIFVFSSSHIISFFPYPSSWLGPPSQQHCLLCHFQHALHSWQVDSHASYMRLSTSYLFLNILPQ